MNAPVDHRSTAERVASAIVKSGFWGNVEPNAVLTLCFLAEAEGHHPAVVYRDYHILQGRPAKKAEAILRDFVEAGGKVKWHALDDKCADATFTHPSGEARIEWTIDRANKAGLKSPMWSKYPRQMLRSRVVSEGVRTVYPGATSGLYEEGEVADIVAESGPVEVPGDKAENSTVSPRQSPARVKWDGRYGCKSKLKAGMHRHHAELERLGIEGTHDDLDAYLASPEYKDFINEASEHAPYYLDGERHPDAPPEFIQTFTLEQKARDLIALRGNVPADMEI